MMRSALPQPFWGERRRAPLRELIEIADRAVDEKKRAELRNGQDVHPTIAVDIRRRELDADAGFVINEVRNKSCASVPIPREPEPVEHRIFVWFDVAARAMSPLAFADD